MKKMLVFLVMAFAVTFAFGQKNVRQTASNYLKAGKLDKALESINQCILDPTTAEDARTWFIRGNVFLEIANNATPEYQQLVENPIEMAIESYGKAIKFDEKKEFYEDILAKLNWQRNNFYNIAVDAYNNQLYEKASINFFKGAEVLAAAEVADTSSILNAAYCASLAGDIQSAKKYYLVLVERDYKSPSLYINLSDIYRQEKDRENALKYIKMGQDAYADNFQLLLAETNIYLTFNDTENALKNLTTAIEKDPSNPSIYFALGTIYDKIANDTTGNEAVQVENFNKAITAYTKALELNSEYFEPCYNLGALYVNKAASINDVANRLPLEQNELYDKLKGEADQYLNQATPFLEKAIELQPNDLNTLYSLKQIYVRMKQTDKLKQINVKIESLTQ